MSTGGLTVPNTKTGPKGPPSSPRLRRQPPLTEWFPEFLRSELAPYPGRAMLALRYVLAATLTMLVIVTFGLPGASVGGFYSLLLPRETPLTTLRAARSLMAACCVSFLLSQMGAMLFVNYPLTHFAWVVGSFFLAFYALAVMSNYAAASAFAILTVLTVPAWDNPVPTAAVVVANLWVAGSVAVAIVATLVVETGFALFRTADPLQAGLADRLTVVEQWLAQSGRGAVDSKTHAHLEQLATVGVSSLRRSASGRGLQDRARLSTVVSLVGRLVDLTVSLPEEALSRSEVQRRDGLAKELGEIRLQLQGKVRRPAEAVPRDTSQAFPLLTELERTAELLTTALCTSNSDLDPSDRAQPPDSPIFVPDAGSNPDHLNFAVRGCVASVICYFLMEAVHYPGLNTSLFTCVVTALTSIGSSRQKQLLRFSGAIVGGLFFGIGSQVLILPALDSISGFSVMFVAVTFMAAWFITASPRISYFGSQMALAFFLIHLRGPFAQTNLRIARDNVLGILLGLVVMGFVFDVLGYKPAVVVMMDLFAENLRLLARLAMPWHGNKPADLADLRAKRDKLSQNFGALNAQADAVLFETGRTRNRSLRVRELLLGWQPRLRALFLLEITWLQYRTRVRPDELAPALLDAQIDFDRELHSLLLIMAETFAGRARSGSSSNLRGSFDRLRNAVDETYHGEPTLRAQAVLALSSHLVEGATSMFEDVCSTDLRSLTKSLK